MASSEDQKVRRLPKGAFRAVNEFLSWLEDYKDLDLYHQGQPWDGSRSDLIGEFFNVDMNRLEEERQAMLERLRSMA